MEEEPSKDSLLRTQEPLLESGNVREEAEMYVQMKEDFYDSMEFPFQEETMQEDDPFEDTELPFSHAGGAELETLLGAYGEGTQQKLDELILGGGENSSAWCCLAVKDCSWCCLYPFVTNACCVEVCQKSCDECNYVALFPLLFVAPLKHLMDYNRFQNCWVSSESESWVSAYSSACATIRHAPLWACC
mmetsp:Transcript_30578/g.57118  ORF Transcript_30578/g.57118 Transcript_30578/m.57118 type:complete len:189 (-) Transcript_30578:396-962(-)